MNVLEGLGAHLADDSNQVNHGIDSGAGALHGVGIQHVARTDLRAVLPGDLLCRAGLRIPGQQMNAVAADAQLPDNFPADKTGSACDQNFHLDLRFTIDA